MGVVPKHFFDLPLLSPIIPPPYFWCSVMVVTNKVGQFPKKRILGQKTAFFCPKFCVFLRYAYETTLFLARTVPTQWDDNSSIS